VWSLLKIRWRCVVNSLQRSRGKNKARRIALLIAILLPFWFTKQNLALFSAWQLMPIDHDLLIGNYVRLSLLALFMLLFFAGISIAIHTHFMAKDLTLLMSQPIPRWQIMAAKQIETALANFLLFLYLGLPALLASGLHHQAGWLYYLMLVPATLLFLLLPTQLAILLSSLMVSLLSYHRARRWAMALFAAVLLLFWGGFYFMQLSRYDPESSSFQLRNLQNLLGFSTGTVQRLFPSAWISGFLSAFLPEGSLSSLWPDLFALLGGVSILGWLAVRASLAVWHRDRHVAVSSKNGVDFSSRISGASDRPAPLMRSLFTKDITLIRRDIRITMQTAIYIGMLCVYSLVMPPIDEKGFSSMLPYVGLGSLAGLIALNLSALLLPFEGLSFIYLKSASLSMRKIVTAKLLTAVAIAGIAMTAALLILLFRQRISLALLPAVWSILLLSICSASAIGLWIGAFYGEFKWERVNHMLTFTGQLFSFVGYALYVFAAALILAGGFYIEMTAVAVFLFLCLSSAVVFCGTLNSFKRLDRIDWSF
jgi:hypothetical protein